ncbi:metal-dependent enzyme [Fervidobacterium sp. SC_NGM5_G05]|nr:metal-dependent enzyme [Fervidobacterium sp. SC_NGM5_G05]
MKVGGQAVIDGVLMMGKKVVVAVRKKNGEIEVQELGSVSRSSKWSKIPFVRGFFSLFYSLYFGIKAINLSAELSSDEKMKKSESFFSILFSIVLAIGLFIVLPAYLTKWLGFKNNEFIFSLVDGFIRLGVFLLYVYIISLFKDVKDVFRYHGAEHKAVHTYENGEELTVENARKYSTIHPRCGTNFVMIFLIIAILVHSVFGIFGPLNMLNRILLRILVLPVVAGIAYELLRLFDKYPSLRILAAPGLLLQKLTTAQPDDSQLEVAIVSLRHALGMFEMLDSVNLENENNSGNDKVDDQPEFLG